MVKTVYHIEWMECRNYTVCSNDVETEKEAVETCKELFGIESEDVKTLNDISEKIRYIDFDCIKYYPVVTEVNVEIVNGEPKIDIKTWFI